MNLHLSYIKYRADRTAEWRKDLSAKYQDSRNKLAAVTLQQIADAADEEVSPENQKALAAYTGSRLVTVVGEIAREVAFRCFPADLNDFVELVLDRLAEDALPTSTVPAVQVMEAGR